MYGLYRRVAQWFYFNPRQLKCRIYELFSLLLFCFTFFYSLDDLSYLIDFIQEANMVRKFLQGPNLEEETTTTVRKRGGIL